MLITEQKFFIAFIEFRLQLRLYHPIASINDNIGIESFDYRIRSFFYHLTELSSYLSTRFHYFLINFSTLSFSLAASRIFQPKPTSR